MNGLTQKRGGTLLTVFAVMCIAAIFSFSLLGCKDDSGDSGDGGGGKSVRVIIRNDSDKDITGIAVYDWMAERWIWGNGGTSSNTTRCPPAEAYDTTKTVAAGATGEFTVNVQTASLGYYAYYDFYVYVDYEGRNENGQASNSIVNISNEVNQGTTDEYTRAFKKDGSRYYFTYDSSY
jgi:hypothetical protein